MCVWITTRGNNNKTARYPIGTKRYLFRMTISSEGVRIIVYALVWNFFILAFDATFHQNWWIVIWDFFFVVFGKLNRKCAPTVNDVMWTKYTIRIKYLLYPMSFSYNNSCSFSPKNQNQWKRFSNAIYTAIPHNITYDSNIKIIWSIRFHLTNNKKKTLFALSILCTHSVARFLILYSTCHSMESRSKKKIVARVSQHSAHCAYTTRQQSDVCTYQIWTEFWA